MKKTSSTPRTHNARIIKPKHGLVGVNIEELWRFRELFFFLSWRDILIRYKQTALGVLWVVIQPLVNVAVFTIIFGYLANLDSQGAPYPLITLAAVIPWQMFSVAVGASSLSLVASTNLVTKTYFPRLIIPLSSTFGTVVDSMIGLVLLLVAVVAYSIAGQVGLVSIPDMIGFHWQVLLLPVFFLIGLSTAIAIGLWLSALNVKYRDIKYVVPFILRIMMLLSPVGYLSSVVPDRFRLLYSLNPLVGVIDGFRWCILGSSFEPHWPGFFISLGMLILLLISGALYFRSTERRFADII